MRAYPKLQPYKRVMDEFSFAKGVVVTEKLDGANFRLMVRADGSVTFGSRETIIKTQEDVEHFFRGYPIYWWDKHPDIIAGLARFVSKHNLPHITIYGETVGWLIQKRIRYFNDDDRVEFYAFDARLGESDVLINSYEDFLRLCDEVGLPHVPVLFKGSPRDPKFLEIINAVEELKTAIGDNAGEQPAEGIVIRSEPLMFTHAGHYLLAKLKGERFSEGDDSLRRAQPTMSDDVVEMLNNFVVNYVTVGRMENVLGKLRAEGVELSNTMADMKVLAPAFWDDLKTECGAQIQHITEQGVKEEQVRQRALKTLQSLYLKFVSNSQKG